MAASTLLRVPSFPSTELTCAFTVPSTRWRRAAISALDSPAPSPASPSRSRSVSRSRGRPGWVFVPAALYLAWQLTTSVLPPSRFGELETGRPRAELARLLPARAYPYPPDHARSSPRPPGTACTFYRSGGDLLGPVDLYRLCWDGDTLVAKDTVPAGPARP